VTGTGLTPATVTVTFTVESAGDPCTCPVEDLDAGGALMCLEARAGIPCERNCRPCGTPATVSGACNSPCVVCAPCTCPASGEGERPIHIPRPSDVAASSIQDGQPNEPLIRNSCKYPGCSKTNVEVCPRCEYCRDCDWWHFGVVHCTTCKFGSDCIASEHSNNTTRPGRNDWCGTCNLCQGCCGQHTGRIVWTGFTATDFKNAAVCVFAGAQHDTCKAPNSSEVVNCRACPSDRFDMCITCVGIRHGIVVCQGCRRHSDCISAQQAGDPNNSEGRRAAGWCHICNRCKVTGPLVPTACCTHT
jgi:hypothetical protein